MSDSSGDTTTSREQWVRARLELLEREKEYTRAGDKLAALRRALPRLKLEEKYVFDGRAGSVSLDELFDGKSQLIVQHIMFGPDWDVACPVCSFWADGFDPMIVHLNQRDVSFVAVSRAPIEKLEEYRKRMGWGFTWVSSAKNSFNFDFGVSATADEVAAGTMTYNYREAPIRGDELHGTSVFARDRNGAVYHTYSTYGRGLDRMNAAYAYIDLTPRGRNEGDLPFSMAWVRRHDEYGEDL